jgi:hypothetical protein
MSCASEAHLILHDLHWHCPITDMRPFALPNSPFAPVMTLMARVPSFLPFALLAVLFLYLPRLPLQIAGAPIRLHSPYLSLKRKSVPIILSAHSRFVGNP